MAVLNLTEVLSSPLPHGWVFLAVHPKGKYKIAYWRCRCICGNERVVRRTTLLRGDIQSCGCATARRAIEVHTKHGYVGTPEYYAWVAMRQRCQNPSNPMYRNYGARGISVCDRWNESFIAFIDDMGPRPGKGYSLDRIQNDGPYSPDNCRWTTQIVQARNTRRNRWVDTPDGRMIIEEATEKYHLPRGVVQMRNKAGLSGEALVRPVIKRVAPVPTKPKRKRIPRPPVITADGPMSVQQIANATGMSFRAIAHRIAIGITGPDLFRSSACPRTYVETSNGRMTISKAARLVGLARPTLRKRLLAGATVDELLAAKA